MADIQSLRRVLPMRQALRHFGVRIHRGDRRGDCPFCEGSSRGTVSFTSELWRCHRCQAAGDVFNFVRAMNRCGFAEALQYVANLAGIKLGRSSGAEIQAQQRRRAQEQAAADAWIQQERELRIQVREELHLLDHVERVISQHPHHDHEQLWGGLQACDQLKRRALATYLLLSFGEPADRIRFLIHPEQRESVLQQIFSRGAVGQYELEALR